LRQSLRAGGSKRIIGTGLLACLAPFLACLIATSDSAALERFSSGSAQVRLIVKRNHHLALAAQARSLTRIRATLVKRLAIPGTEVIAVPKDHADAAIKVLRADPAVEWVEPDVIVRAAGSAPSLPPTRFRVTVNDPSLNLEWAFSNTGQAIDGFSGTAGADSRVRLAWNLASGLDPDTGSGVIVAVVDGGLDESHVDLVNRIASNPGEIDGNGKDDDANGYVDDVAGWDFVDSDADPAVATEAHGTHVAGIIAARRNNRQAISGVAPLSRLTPLRVLASDGSGHLSDVAAAFDYAGSMGIPVVNASLSGSTGDADSHLILEAVQRHPNTLYVVAAGNSGANLDSQPTTPCVEPAANIICVAASDQVDGRYTTSNWSSSLADIFAPGAKILSIAPGGGTAYKSGTSMAAPLVAGTAALVISAGGSQRGSALRQLLIDTAASRPSLSDLAVGGRLDALAAVMRVKADSDLDGLADGADSCPTLYSSSDSGCPEDADSDGVSNDFDNCPSKANADQVDADRDGIGNLCDYTPRGEDPDRDGVPALDDNCPVKANALQLDSDADGIGNSCDPTPFGPDVDLDGIPALDDNCPSIANVSQVDTDSDRVGDACDPTPRGADRDHDSLPALDDRCPEVAGARANRGCPWPAPKIKKLKLTRRGSALRLRVAVDITGSVKVTLWRYSCKGSRCRWVPQPALTRSLKAGKLTGIELGRLSAGRYRVSLAPAARGVTGRTVSKLVKIS